MPAFSSPPPHNTNASRPWSGHRGAFEISLLCTKSSSSWQRQYLLPNLLQKQAKIPSKMPAVASADSSPPLLLMRLHRRRLRLLPARQWRRWRRCRYTRCPAARHSRRSGAAPSGLRPRLAVDAAAADLAAPSATGNESHHDVYTHAQTHRRRQERTGSSQQCLSTTH